MFEKEYKNTMNSIVPSDDAINKTLDALKQETTPKRRINFRNTLHVATIACICVALIFTTVITALHVSDIWGEYSDTTSNNDYSVDYSDYIYNSEFEDDKGDKIEISIDGLKQASSYEEIAELLKNHYSNTNGGVFDDFWVEREEEILLEGTMKPSIDNKVPENEIHDEPSEEPMEEPSETPEHSETNNQVKDVEEADIVKTDGKFIYYSNNSNKKINIVKINGSIMEEVSSIKISDKETLLEMVLFEDKLLVLTQGYSKNSITYSYYYDITDRANPKETAKLSQDGYYLTSRTINGTVFIITCHMYHSIYGNIVDAIIPECNGTRIEPEDIIIADTIDSPSFTIITSYDAKDDSKQFKSHLSFLGASDILYATTDNIYLTKNTYIDGKTTNSGIYKFTSVFRIGLDSKELTITGKSTVPGSVLNQFSMDEKDGCLRIATNVYRYNYSQDKTHVGGIEYNQVFCLDKDMNIIGESDILGKDEHIKSVRYIGDIAYVVTFRQTDPLYAVDLTDPKNPKTLSELKIAGFSTYMHPYGSDYLIGIGFDADPKTGWTTGIKVTVFDVSDPKNIFDVCTYTREYSDEIGYIDSPAIYNHKAVFIDYKKGVISIPLTRQHKYVVPNTTPGVNTFNYERETVYMFLDFNGKDISEKAFIDLNNDALGMEENVRALYIGDYAYIVSESGIVCMDLKEYGVVSELKFE